MGRLLSINETARIYGNNRNNWALLIELGLLPQVLFPGKTRPMLDEDDIKKFIEDHKTQKTDPRLAQLFKRLAL
jgi:hypothetical protein